MPRPRIHPVGTRKDREYSRCWRCDKNRVRLPGLACAACLVILHAEYDAAKAANGGKLLYIPPDWDGPAEHVNDNVVECCDCHELFAPLKGAGKNVKRCPDCARIANCVRTALRMRRERGDPTHRAGEARDLGLDLKNVV